MWFSTLLKINNSMIRLREILAIFILFLAFLNVSGQNRTFEPAIYKQAENFIHKNAPSSVFSIKQIDKENVNKKIQISIVRLKPRGFIIISSDPIKPVWAFSFENNFDTSFDKLGTTKTLLSDISHQKPEIKHKKQSRKQETLGPFVQTLWGQVNCYDKNNHLINVTNYYTPDHYAAGCVAISMSTLLHFYRWPIKGTGTFTDNDNKGSSTGSYSVDFSKSAYDWENMLDRYRYKTSTLIQRQAAGKLAFEAAVALGMDFEQNGSTSNVNKIPSVSKNHLRFDGVERTPSSNIFWPMLDSNIAHGIPVIFAVKANNGAGHSIVCDGLKIDDNGDCYYHLNMGWWGNSNGWYRIRDSWNSGGYTSITDAVFYFLPIPELNTPYAQTGENKVIIRWRYPAKAQVEAFELQEKTNNENWISLDNTIQDTFYTVDVHPDQQQYFRLRAKVAGRWPFDDWSNVEKITLDVSGVNDHTIDTPMEISPNPVSDKLNIHFNTTFLWAEITIIDINGKKIAYKKLNHVDSEMAINVDNLRRGIYFVRIINENHRVKTLKFIKK